MRSPTFVNFFWKLRMLFLYHCDQTQMNVAIRKKRFKLRRAAVFMHMQQVNSFHVVRDHICFMFSVTKVCGFRSVVCKLLTRFACCLFGSVPKGFYLFVHCPFHRFSLCTFYCWTDAIFILEWFIAWGLFLSFYFLGFF